MAETWHEKLKNKNREEILSAAKELFFKKNFLNVSIKDVCMLAGISRVTFYKNFESIEELIFEIHVDILNTLSQYLRTADNPNVSGRERLRLVLDAWVDFGKLNKDQVKFIVLFDLNYECFNHNEGLNGRREAFLMKEINDHLLNEVLIAGLKDKSFREDLDVIKIGCYIFSMMMGLLLKMSSSVDVYENKEMILTEVAESTIESVINYIGKED